MGGTSGPICLCANRPVSRVQRRVDGVEGTIQRSAARFVHCAARIMGRHIDICRRDGRDQTEQPERGKLHRKREEPEARAREADAA